MTTQPPNPAEGALLGGRYTLTSPIASGGMGDVWRARDGVLGRDVAVKVMRNMGRPGALEATFAERFRDEARHSAALSHPNIATVYDYGEDDGAAYLVMELVEGEPLSQVIARGASSPARVRSVIGQAALALQAAHDGGVVHRDVKPANILLTPEGRVKLTDFGIARAGDGASYTRTGEVLGTPQYLSPEQALGHVATGASDIYALGIIAWEMLVGRKPFDAGSAVATALAQVNDPAPALPDDVPADLRRIVMSCLAKEPERRPASALALAAAMGMPVSGVGDVTPAATVLSSDTDPTATAVIPPPVAGAQGEPTAVADYGYVAPPPAVPPASETQDPAADPEKKRGGIGLWWIPIGVLLVAAAIFLGAYLTSGSSGTPTTPATTTTTTAPATTTTTESQPTTITPTRPTESTTTTTTTAVATVNINPATYVGKPVTEAQAVLEGLGFAANQITIVEQVNAKPAGTVLSITPTGKVEVTATITLTVSAGSSSTAP